MQPRVCSDWSHVLVAFTPNSYWYYLTTGVRSDLAIVQVPSLFIVGKAGDRQ
jgi:hypothetical protein